MLFRSKKVLKFIFIVFLLLGITAGFVLAPTVIKGYKMYQSALDTTSLNVKTQEINEKDDYTTINNISVEFLTELVNQEDHRFLKHNGFDIIAFTRACLVNLATGDFSQGGSTITQQLAKNLYFSFEKKIERKVAELFMAFTIEKQLTKSDILELYCNLVYFGQDCYGVQAAAQYYYGVDADKITPLQAIKLVDALKAPSISNPYLDSIA